MQQLQLEDRAPYDPLRLALAPAPDGADVDGVLGATTLACHPQVSLLTYSLAADKPKRSIRTPIAYVADVELVGGGGLELEEGAVAVMHDNLRL